MSTQELTKLSDELNNMILEGRILEAFDKFYAPDVKMQDNDLPVRQGFQENRDFEESFVANLTEFRGAQMVNRIVSDGVVAGEWQFDYTHKEWGVRNYTQISVQRWKEGKIVEEKFYYNN
jgi:hypothetical protein